MVSTAVDASARARVVGIKTTFKNLGAGNVFLLPQQIAVIGQGNTAAVYTNDAFGATSALEVAERVGFGSPLHLAALQLLPANGDGVGTIPVTFYPLDDDASGVAATGDVTPSGAVTKQGAFVIRINNIASGAFVVDIGDTVADIVDKMVVAMGAELNLPMTGADGTTQLDLTAKWEGTSGNDLNVVIDGPDDTGVSFAVTQPSGGLVNPDVDDALNLIGEKWETIIVNCLESADTTTLDKYFTFGDGRWGALVRKPLFVVTGTAPTDVASAIAVSDTRKTDRVNALIPEPGGSDLPAVIAARAVARIAVTANNNPARDYGSQKLTGLTAGSDADQWTYPERDLVFKGGSGTTLSRDGVVNLQDSITMFQPDGDPTPAYQYLADLVKLQNIIFNTALLFDNEEWDGAPLIPDEQPTTNPSAKKPRTAVALVAAMLDNLGLNAIISDPETAKATIVAVIDGSNPKRLNVTFTVQLAGNANIISIDLDFGFFFGTAPVVA